MADLSVVGAADRAIEETKRQLFPARLERWFALGFVAFIEQCGRGGMPLNIPGGGGGGGGRGGSGDGDAAEGAKEIANQAMSFMASHVVMVALIAAVVLALILAISAVVLWIRSRGTFMYIDNVATGRYDVGRPWQEHAGRASSYFAWTFCLSIGTLVVILLLLAPIGWAAFSLFKHGAHAGPITAIGLSLLLLLVAGLGSRLLAVALRDFVAPLQWYCDLSCGAALRLFGGLLAAHPGVFALYLLVKIAFSIVLGIVSLIFGCLACCCFCLCLGFLPVVQQTVLQPLFYFERRFSLELLQQFGYGPPSIS